MRTRIAVMAATAGLLAAMPVAAQAAFPGENGKIAYTLRVDDGVSPAQNDVFTINPGLFNRTNLTNTPGSESGPSWSADGRELVMRSSTGFGRGIFTIDADGGNLTRVPGDSGVLFPVWSPDGTRIAYGREPDSNDNNYEIYAVYVDGTGRTNLTQSPGVDLSPSWSPDGRKIAFNSARASVSDIYTMNADGTDVVRLTTSGGNFDPDWSPDGSRIAFMSRYDIHVINADGTGEVSFGAPGDDWDPAWSPDGTKIAFLSRRHGFNFEVYVMTADGADATRVTVSASDAGAPSWQPINRSPACASVRATPASLGPPNHRFVAVTLSGATDPDGDAVTIAVTGVTQDEPTGGASDAASGPGSGQVQVRAERDGGGDGRVYRVAFDASDGRGGTCSGTVEVSVPKGSRPAVDSAPPSYDSFGS
jgi:Tol biopolymer transport system component